MRKFFVFVFLLFLSGAGCNTFFMEQKSQSQTEYTELIESEAPQNVEFSLNRAPLTGGPAYRFFDPNTLEVKTISGNMVVVSSNDFQSIESKASELDVESGAPYYQVKAEVKLQKITERNDAVPGAPQFTYFEAKILNIESIH